MKLSRRVILEVLEEGGRLWRGEAAARAGNSYWLVSVRQTSPPRRVRQATVEALLEALPARFHQEIHGEGTDEVYVAPEHACEFCKGK